MNKPETELFRRQQILPARKLQARVAGTFAARGGDFVSAPVDALKLVYGGVVGDFHAGLTRPSGGREPWYPRGTEMKNERQLSVLSVEELSQVASDMGIARIAPEWIGANLVLEGVPTLSYLPPRSLLFFKSGATLRIDGANGPCRIAGGSIAKALGVKAPVKDGAPDHEATDIAFGFVQAARMKRGLVAWVEREGEIRSGETVDIRIWEQWIY
jgi:hypothetical protein